MLLVLYFLIVKISQISGCPCENAGTCYNGYRCTCLAHFTGNKCQTALFVKPSTGGLCSYHIQPKDTMSASNAQIRCKDLGGVLAIVETKEKQEAIENVFFDSYGSSMTVYLNFGFHSNLYLDNYRNINFYPDEDFFPPWGWLLYTDTSDNKVLTNDPSYWYPGKDNNRKLYWGLRSSNSNAGYVCEKHDTGACTDEICNGEPCENRGCTVKCNCNHRITKTFDCLEAQSTCGYYYCRNFGNCRQNGADATCKCRHGYSGTTCQYAIYYRDDEQKDMCEYQVNFMGVYDTFDRSNLRCRGLKINPWHGESIATIRNKHQLKALENIARRFYSHTYITLWVAGIRGNDGKYVLPGGLMLDDITTNDFPRWGTGQPSSDSSENYLQVTTIPSYAPGGSNPERLFYWRSANPSSKSGYTCERYAVNSAPPCAWTPCKNGGTCVESGCSFHCNCLSLFTGYNCTDCLNPTPCNTLSCNGRGVCTREGCTQSYTCDCDYGWSENECQVCILTPCDRNPCLNGATCENAADCSGNYDCICIDGYTGKNCETCMYDPCVSDPCLNKGECYMANNCSQQYSCSCIPFYKGLSCETRNFVVGENTDSCAYFADMNVGSGDFSSVNSFCESLNSSLAMIKTMFQQQHIIELILKSYSEEVLSFWIGGQFKKSEWLWLDNNKIKTVTSEGFPEWGAFQPSINEIETGILLSNSPEFSNELGMKTKSLVWASDRNYLKHGFVCEKASHYGKCGSYPCINGGKCVEIGCSYRCVCLKGFAGLQCEYMYPRLKSSTPSFIPFSTNFSLSCTVEGLTLPLVTWKVLKGDDNDDEEEEIIDQTKDEGSSFIITTEYNYNYIVSTLTVTKIGFCLNEASITCWATNIVQKEPLILKSFSMKTNYLFAINDSYYIFSDEQLYTKIEAENKCKEVNGKLALVSNEVVTEEISNVIDNKMSNKTWIEDNAWIGLQKEEHKSWSDSTVSSYSNWESSEPSNNKSCVYISLESKWKTHSCIDDNFKAHYICEIKNRGVPNIVELSTPYGVGGRSSVIVQLIPHSDMIDVTHELRAVLVSNGSGINHTEFIKVVPSNNLKHDDNIAIAIIDKLFPEENYTVIASISPEACSVPISDQKSVHTKSASVAYLRLENQTCFLRWVFPREQLRIIQHFTLNITKLPYFYANQRKELFIKQLQKESKLINQSTNIDSYEFEALPNRINHVEIIGRTTIGNDVILIPGGKCEVKPKAPAKLDPPVVSNGLFSTPSIQFNLADETNGPISCFFVIATSYDNKPEENNKKQISQTFMDRANSYFSEAMNEAPYIALAVPKTETLTSIDFLLGNEKNSSCNIFNTKPQNSTSNVQKRSVDSNIIEYKGHNIPMVSFRYYSFALVTSTPTEDDLVLFESSQSQVEYINLYKGITVYLCFGVFALFAAAMMTMASLKFAEQSKRKHKNTILPYFPVPSSDFDIIKDKNNIQEISPKKITKIKKLNGGKLFEDWLVEIPSSLTTTRATEAFAKVVKGASLRDRQRQDFAMEIEIMRRFTNHDFLVELFGVCFDTDETILVMERCPYGSLQEYLRQLEHGDNTYYFVVFVIQIAKGLQHLHKLHIVHRSLSCSTIFLSVHSSCKIGDFSCARILDKKEGRYCIPDIDVTQHEYRWMAPEAYHEHVFTRCSDVWSLGVVMWEIFSYGEVPYKDIKNRNLERKLIDRDNLLSIPKDCPTEIYEMMQPCWNALPMFRPSARKVKQIIQDFAVSTLGMPKVEENMYEGLYYNTEYDANYEDAEGYYEKNVYDNVETNIKHLQKQFSDFFDSED